MPDENLGLLILLVSLIDLPPLDLSQTYQKMQKNRSKKCSMKFLFEYFGLLIYPFKFWQIKKQV